MPAAVLPAVPDGFRPLVVAGRGLVIAGWVSYEGASVLRYGELFAAVVGFARRRLTATVTHMWVDSPASRDGGRALWGYPKELAELHVRIDPAGSARAADDRGELAHGTFRSWLTAPRALRAATGTVQPLDGELKGVRAIARGRPVLGRRTFVATPGGPLAFLGSGRRLLCGGVRDFHVTFGV